jgi:CubicO group peptidase (beta-lactamase class C family)
MELQQKVDELAGELEVPGVAVGVLHDGVESYAFHGVTSVENPLSVDASTFFQFGSTGKTYTATALMRLVEQGRVELDAPVRRYVPELTLKDPQVAETVTVGHLLNHTAGWEGDLMDDTGSGDDALARYVQRMGELEQSRPPGVAVSYNNASLSLAGHVLERVLGTTYEQAIRDLVLDPLGLTQTLFFPNEVMTRRFAVGHTRHEDGRITVARPWALPRSGNPAGGMSATARDQLAWARFHLSDGRADDGERILSEQTLRLMQQPTVQMLGSALGDYVGISWLLRDVGGVRLVGHGGTTIGQYSEFTMVPERGFALISMTNCGPNGSEFNHHLQSWALGFYLGLDDSEPEAIDAPPEVLAGYVGRYETVAAVCEVTAGDGRLAVNVSIKPAAAAVMRESGEEVPEEQPAIPLGLLAADSDQFVVPDGPAKGMRGFFTRGGDGEVDAVHLGGRLASRVATPAEA